MTDPRKGNLNSPQESSRNVIGTGGASRDGRAASDAARAPVVNRTHRIVREQALSMRAQRNRSRSLWVPLAICSTLLLVICYAMWAVTAGYDLTPTSIPDASDQMLLVLLLWSLPIAAVALGMVWFRRGGQQNNAGGRAR